MNEILNIVIGGVVTILGYYAMQRYYAYRVNLLEKQIKDLEGTPKTFKAEIKQKWQKRKNQQKK